MSPREEGLIAWSLAVILFGAVAIVALPVLVPEIRPPEAYIACDREAGRWDAGTGVCHPSDSPRAGTAP